MMVRYSRAPLKGNAAGLVMHQSSLCIRLRINSDCNDISALALPLPFPAPLTSLQVFSSKDHLQKNLQPRVHMQEFYVPF